MKTGGHIDAHLMSDQMSLVYCQTRSFGKGVQQRNTTPSEKLCLFVFLIPCVLDLYCIFNAALVIMTYSF